MTSNIPKLALGSRLIVLTIQLMAKLSRPDVLRLPEGETYAAYSVLDKLILNCLGGLRHWKGDSFLDVASYLYSYELLVSFYTLFPMLVSVLSKICIALHVPLSMETLTLHLAVLLNLWLFIESAKLLYKLTQLIFKDLSTSWYAALIFCCNPATICFSAAYSETTLTFLSFYLMLQCLKPKRDYNYFGICGALIACCLCRAYGLLIIFFPLYFFGLQLMLLTNPGRLLERTKMVLKFSTGFIMLLIICIYVCLYQNYCGTPRLQLNVPKLLETYELQTKTVAAGQATAGSPWCNYTLPFPAFYVQLRNWNVETFYWSNLVLVLPMLLYVHYHCYFARYIYFVFDGWKLVLMKHNTVPFMFHAALLIIVCTLTGDVQGSLRLVDSATPVFHWLAARPMPKSLYKISLFSKPGLLFIFCITYGILGIVLLSNNYLWI